MKITATIQARMGSKRLPGKVLSDINGKPMLSLQIERIRRSRLIDNIIVATSNSKKDNKIVDFCLSENIDYFRGSEKDVIKRITELLKQKKVELHIEFYGDSPLIDPNLIDEHIAIFLKNSPKLDYLSNGIKTTYPPGSEFNIYKAQTLIEVEKSLRKDDPLREHVGYNITRFANKYNIKSIDAPYWYNYPDIYLEVDEEEDLKLIRAIDSHFLKSKSDFYSLKDIIYLLKEKPELAKINCKVKRRWKELRGE